MKKTFWEKLKKPFFCLAPMSDVTDPPFRRMIAKYGKPDVMWTEFVSADGLALGQKEEILKNLKFTKKEKPIVAQVFTSNPKNMRIAAKIIQQAGFDGIDINMGCPDRKIEKQGAGAALIKNPKFARKLIKAAKSGAPNIPVSVKTRIGYNKNEIEEWISELLKETPVALTIHWRTRKEMSRAEARWKIAPIAVKLRDKISPKTLIIGNGDIKSLNRAKKISKQTGVDGVMIGRGVFGNPWFFSGKNPSKTEKLKALLEHSRLYEKLSGHKSFAIMKKHFKAYANGYTGAKKLRVKLMNARNSKEAEKIIKKEITQNTKTIL